MAGKVRVKSSLTLSTNPYGNLARLFLLQDTKKFTAKSHEIALTMLPEKPIRYANLQTPSRFPFAMKVQRTLLSLVFAASCAALTSAQAGMFNLNPDASDARVLNRNDGSANTIIDAGFYAARVGEQNAPGGTSYVFAFQLPTFTGGDTAFTAASLQLKIFGVDNANNTLGNVDFYGLGVRTNPAPLTTDYFQGTLDAGNTLIQQSFLTPANASVGSFVTPSTQGSIALVNYLNSVDLNGINAGKYVVFRLSYAVSPIPDGNNAYTVLTQDAGGADEKPVLSLTSGVVAGVPEPTTYCLLAIGGLGLMVFRRRARA